MQFALILAILAAGIIKNPGSFPSAIKPELSVIQEGEGRQGTDVVSVLIVCFGSLFAGTQRNFSVYLLASDGENSSNNFIIFAEQLLVHFHLFGVGGLFAYAPCF